MERSIIINSGRCGSTLLSDLIAEDPDTLSVHEFFMAMPPWAVYEDRVLTGDEYWAMLSSPKRDLATLFRIGAVPTEISYPATGRWAADLLALPRILSMTLPKLSSDPDELFDWLSDRVTFFPKQSVTLHHRDFLDLLAGIFDKRRWVERSGASSMASSYLLASFPAARIIYLTRDLAATAKSMSRHPWFQLARWQLDAMNRYGVNPLEASAQPMPAELVRVMQEELTADALRTWGEDVNRFVELCAFLSARTEKALADSPPEHLLRLRYEDLVLDPVAELTAVGEFLNMAEPRKWADSVAHRVRTPGSVPVGS